MGRDESPSAEAPQESSALIDRVARLLAGADAGDVAAEEDLERLYDGDARLQPAGEEFRSIRSAIPLPLIPWCTHDMASQ